MCVQLKNTENWSNRIKNYIKESWGGCFLCIPSYTNSSYCNDLIKWYIEGESNIPYSSHGSVGRDGRRAPHLGEMPSQGRTRRWLRVEDEVGAKCHRSVKAIICSCSLLQEIREGIEWGTGATPSSDKDMTLLDVFLNGRRFLQGSCQPFHGEQLCPWLFPKKAPFSFCRIWSSSGSNSLIRWLAANCRLQFYCRDLCHCKHSYSNASGRGLAAYYEQLVAARIPKHQDV